MQVLKSGAISWEIFVCLFAVYIGGRILGSANQTIREAKDTENLERKKKGKQELMIGIFILISGFAFLAFQMAQ